VKATIAAPLTGASKVSDSSIPVMIPISRIMSDYDISHSMVYKLAGLGHIDIRKCGSRSLVTGESLAKYLTSLPSAPIRRVA
jgi:hypothetical protein